VINTDFRGTNWWQIQTLLGQIGDRYRYYWDKLDTDTDISGTNWWKVQTLLGQIGDRYRH